MVDRPVRYLNPNPKFPAPSGGAQLLDAYKAPAQSDIRRERLPAPSALKQPTVVSPGKDALVTNSKETSGRAKGASEISPELGAWLAVQQGTPREQGERQDPKSFVDGDRGKGVVLTFERVEALQAARADSRGKTANALRQLAESVSSGGLPWELFQAGYDETSDPSTRSRPGKQPGGSKEIGLSQSGQSGQFAEIVVPLAEGIVRAGHWLLVLGGCC